MEEIKDNNDHNSVNGNIHKSKNKRKKGISDFKLKCWVSIIRTKILKTLTSFQITA